LIVIAAELVNVAVAASAAGAVESITPADIATTAPAVTRLLT
jgi:hypothetical protein